WADGRCDQHRRLSEGPDERAADSEMDDAAIGPKDQADAAVFSFVAITPHALGRDQGTRWGRGYLILNNVSWAGVEAAVRDLLLHCSGDNWAQVAEKLNREMHWESRPTEHDV